MEGAKGLTMRRVLVTGGAGFIGSHLCEALIARGDDVFMIDDLSTGSYENIRGLKGNSTFHITIGSILDRSLLEPLVVKVDVVYHLAAAVGVQKIIEAPVDTIETNILGSHNVLSLCAKFHKTVLLASTSEVYGKSNLCPFREEDDSVYGPTTKSRWSYACSKAIDEFLALAYAEEKGLPVVIVRLFNTAGPRQTGRYGMVLPRFIKQALEGAPITVYGNGRQSRCFANVSDVVSALLKLVDEPRSLGQVFNVGNPAEISIYELAEKVKRMTGSTSKIELIPYDEAYSAGFEDMERRVPCIDKIAALVGFAPNISLEQTIAGIVESIKPGAPILAER
ncbi:MAG: NAD-dependent epimerase/dehydratase family protein [Terriglobales bacterium]|jgi:UDP-glucose 4-epimerase